MLNFTIFLSSTISLELFHSLSLKNKRIKKHKAHKTQTGHAVYDFAEKLYQISDTSNKNNAKNLDGEMS